MVVPEHRVANEQGDGSRSEIEDEKTGDIWDTKDQRADTETTFYKSDIDRLNVSQAQKHRLKRALRLQEGEQVNSDEYDSRGQQNHKEDKRRLIGAFTSQLGLTPHQKERITHIVMDVVEVNSYGNYSIEEVVLGVITYVCMEDIGMTGTHVDDRDVFQRIASDIDTTMDRIKRARNITRERIRE